MLIYDPMKIFFEQSPIIDNKYFPKLSATLLIQDASTIIYKYLQPIVTQYLVCNKSEIWP